MRRIPPERQKRIQILSAAAGVIAYLASFVLTSGFTLVGITNSLVIGLIVGLIPPSVVDVLHGRWKDSIERNMPQLLNDIANAQRTGITFIKALQLAATRRYGALSTEVKMIVAKISWGIPFEIALTSFAERAQSSMVNIVTILIEETAKIGGDIATTIGLIAEFIRNMEGMEVERKSQMRVYTLIILLAFLIFIFVIGLTYNTFFLQMAKIGSLIPNPVDVELYRVAFYHMALVESVFGGLIAGKIGGGELRSGLKYVVIMLAISLYAFNVFII